MAHDGVLCFLFVITTKHFTSLYGNIQHMDQLVKVKNILERDLDKMPMVKTPMYLIWGSGDNLSSPVCPLVCELLCLHIYKVKNISYN